MSKNDNEKFQIDVIWNKVKEILKGKIDEFWYVKEIEPLKLLCINGTEAVIKGQSAYSNASVEEDYGPLIEAVLKDVTGQSLSVSYDPSFPKPESKMYDLSENEIIWEKTKKICRIELSPLLYKMWIKPLRVKSFDNCRMTIATDSVFKKDIIEEQFSQIIQNALVEVTGITSIQLSIVVEPTTPAPLLTNELYVRLGWSQNGIDRLKCFTFDNFPETQENMLAVASIRDAIDHPGDHTPLIICGITEDERIHLWNAIVNYFAETAPSTIIVLKMIETFLDEMIMDRRNNTNRYHKQYDQAEFLIFGDFEFIERGNVTQDECYQILQRMTMENKQVILFSASPISALQLANENLKRLLDSGTIVSIPKQDISE